MVDNDANYLTAQRYLIEHSGFCVTGDSPFREVPLRVKVVGFFTLSYDIGPPDGLWASRAWNNLGVRTLIPPHDSIFTRINWTTGEWSTLKSIDWTQWFLKEGRSLRG